MVGGHLSKQNRYGRTVYYILSCILYFKRWRVAHWYPQWGFHIAKMAVSCNSMTGTLLPFQRWKSHNPLTHHPSTNFSLPYQSARHFTSFMRFAKNSPTWKSHLHVLDHPGHHPELHWPQTPWRHSPGRHAVNPPVGVAGSHFTAQNRVSHGELWRENCHLCWETLHLGELSSGHIYSVYESSSWMWPRWATQVQ